MSSLRRTGLLAALALAVILIALPLGLVTPSACHAGDPAAMSPEAAHKGLVSRPSAQPEKSCGSCHGGITSTFTRSLHFTARGMENGLRALVGNVRWSMARQPFRAACQSCHATCGDCHVSRPPYRPQPPAILGSSSTVTSSRRARPPR